MKGTIGSIAFIGFIVATTIIAYELGDKFLPDPKPDPVMIEYTMDKAQRRGIWEEGAFYGFAASEAIRQQGKDPRQFKTGQVLKLAKVIKQQNNKPKPEKPWYEFWR